MDEYIERQMKQCDICKKIYVYRENSTEQIRIIDYYVFWWRECDNICPECVRKIRAFLNGETEELK